MFASIGISLAAIAAVAFWARNKGRIPELFGKGMKWFEGRTGVDIPDQWELWAIEKLKEGVAYANATFGSRLFWRTVFRLAMKDGGTPLVDRFVEWVSTIDPVTLIESQVPEEFKPLMNQAKQEIAERVVVGKIVSEAPAAKQEVLLAKVTPSIKAIARADIPAESTKRPDLDSILEYHRQLKAALLSKGTQMPAGVPLPSQIQSR
jgi:hypothetical protein